MASAPGHASEVYGKYINEITQRWRQRRVNDASGTYLIAFFGFCATMPAKSGAYDVVMKNSARACKQ